MGKYYYIKKCRNINACREYIKKIKTIFLFLKKIIGICAKNYNYQNKKNRSMILFVGRKKRKVERGINMKKNVIVTIATSLSLFAVTPLTGYANNFHHQGTENQHLCQQPV